MDRLTKRIKDSVYYTKGEYQETLPAECNSSDVRAILNCLAAYEDTGLTPDEITESRKAMSAALALACEVQAFRNAEQSGGWISVEEALPEEGVPVQITYLGFLDKKPYSDGVAQWSIGTNGRNGGWEWTFDDSGIDVEITHWQPLPKPPKRGDVE